MVAAEDAAGMASEVVEQAKLGGGGGDQLAVDAKLHGAGVDLDILELQNGRRAWPFEAAQNGLDAGDQFARGEGLGDVVVGTQFEAVDAVVLRRACGEEDDRNDAERGVQAEPAAEIEAITARHHDVEQEECGRLSFSITKYLIDSQIRADNKPALSR